MTSVLGVSVGTSAVRLARPVHGLRAGVQAAFRHRAIDTTFDQAEQLAAESIGVILADPADPESVSATGVAYRDDAQAGAVARAMARQHIVNYRLVPEVHAAVEFLRSTGDLDGLHTVALYDLGSSGLSVTVVDLDDGRVLASQRSFDVSGNMFDATIRDSQISRQQSGLDDVDGREFELRCRVAKEQLSSSGAVCLPGIGGLILLSREAFESMVAVPVEQSARLTREVIARAGRPVDALVMIGGGSRIPLVRATLAGWVGLPTITPAEPELVAAKGAALSATPVDGSDVPFRAAPVQGPPEPAVEEPLPERPLTAPSAATMAYSDVQERPASASALPTSDVADPRAAETPSWLSGSGSVAPERTKRPRLPLVAALGLAVVAAIGLALGYGATPASTADESPAEPAAVTTSSSSTTVPPTTSTRARSTTATPTTTIAPPPPVVEAPAPVEEAPEAPAPAPYVPPTIPGLPGVQLPPGIQIPPGLIPGF
ncbi:Hsp70 family protein [Rhodococcus sp. MEB064]|uniref:Hsp70 family protein n=1 Tax=Rhodococcus sp. MEB064 TaxID=1587522 RepID=UPI0005AC5D6E|nr:Hsp70 family protein [Rhodococcus sp. MEB064]KIQ11787.1 hypothetical protein RU01_18490 [Rhodococcus sp. MEB064]